ncbi:hypothetical protein ACP70R_010348 [Stipagrostis hirtigluma subsp. patula]
MANNSTSAANHGRCLSETSSRCVTGSVTAAHNFEVTNFALLDGMGISKFISSSTFNAGGRDWKSWSSPVGTRGPVGARAKLRLSLFAKDEQEQVSKECVRTFQSVGDDWGFREFIKKSKLQELLSLTDDCFTIRCVLTVIEDPHTKGASNAVVPESKLHQDLTQMLKNGEGADVTFCVGGKTFGAHKCMLAARSMVFKAELFGAMKEKDTQCIKIDDMEPTIFQALLHFIYADSLPDDCDAEENVKMQHLLVAADRYGLDRLRMICESKLCQGIDEQTVATTLVLAEQHHCKQLKDACLGFIASSRDGLGVVMKTDGFKHLIASCPLVMKETRLICALRRAGVPGEVMII